MAQSGYSLGNGPGIPSLHTGSLGDSCTGANHSQASQNSFDQNRQTIPGLGLGFFGKAETSAPSQMTLSEKGNPTVTNHAIDDSAEEGEVSEDEFEDLYEPQGSVAVTEGAKIAPEINASYVEMSDEERDRSGSYSPFLSEREIDVLPAELAPQSADHSKTATVHETFKELTKPVDVLEEAKNKAKEAILRLRGVNIRYQDFLNEGIDKAVLDQLFTDLGLDKSSNEPVTKTAVNSGSLSTESDIPTTTSHEPILEASTSTDKSEERKDRIARLLAAKGSKAPKAGSVTVVGKIGKASNAKVNSEKSKLLQQKMEALLKAREEKQKQIERQVTVAESNMQPKSIPDSLGSDSVDAIATSFALPVTATNDEAARPSTEGVTSASSPEKVLVWTQTGSSSASDGPFQKSFGHTGPFLIDVSDDEEDTDMEIESPEQRLSSLHALNSPGRVQAPAPSLTQSPGSLATPPSRQYDLENMNKKIEAMKRKIAMAEAKKKLKLSAPASPAASPRPKAYDIYETKSSSPDNSALATQSTTYSRVKKEAEPQMTSPASPKMNRSRAASERLPMLESRRKEQLLRLKVLQSQVANIEKELKEGFEEEQKLREDLDYISDDDVTMPTAPELAAAQMMTAQPAIENAAVPTAPRQNLPNPIDILSSDDIATESSSRSTPEDVRASIPPEHAVGTTRPVLEPQQTVDLEALHDTDSERNVDAVMDEADSSGEDSEHNEDAVMDEADSSGEEADGGSDGYEPADASPLESRLSSPNLKMAELAPELTDKDPAAAALSAELLSAGRQGSSPVLESEREVVPASLHCRVAQTNEASLGARAYIRESRSCPRQVELSAIRLPATLFSLVPIPP